MKVVCEARFGEGDQTIVLQLAKDSNAKCYNFTVVTKEYVHCFTYGLGQFREAALHYWDTMRIMTEK